MKPIINSLNDLLKNKGVNKSDLRKFLLFIIGIIIVSSVLIFTPFFSKIGPIVFIISFSILFSVLWFVAGYAVFRSLLVASIGLSFIIFIGQSYCAPNVAHVANDSLKTLIGFGIIYTCAQFCRNLYCELFGYKKSKEEWKQKGIIEIFKEANQGKHSWLILVIYIPLVSLFIWQIYRVIVPIINSLCVY